MLWGSTVLVFRLVSLLTSDEHILFLAFAFVELLLLILILQFRGLREILENLMKGEW